MASRTQSPEGKTQRSNLSRQIVIGLSIASVLLCTILGSSLLTIQEGAQKTSSGPTATPTLEPVFPPTSTPVPAVTATPTSSPTPTLPPIATSTLQPGETPPADATPTLPATATPTSTAMPPATATPCHPPTSWQGYTVQSGDTLTRLAWRHGTTVSAIMQANCLKTTTIYRGQRLYLPPRQAPPTPVPTRCVPRAPAGWVGYVVQSGDTLYGLALRHRTTLVQIREVNCLTDYDVYAGQQLYLPPLPATVTPTWTSVPTATSPVTPTTTLEPTVSTPTSTAVPPTETPTTEPTWTPIVTATATVAPTATVSPTLPTVPSPTATTQGLTPTATSTTPAETPTPLPTATVEATATETPTPLPTTTDTPSPTPTPTATPST